MVQQRYIVNQRLQLRLQVEYETGLCGGIYIQQRVFPQQRKKELGLDLRYGAQAMGYYQMHPTWLPGFALLNLDDHSQR
ncbi:hypothetical protein C5S36_14630 [Candidatus Methanophagaceae archaeon]|nr:hypothetical protein C5S36_14630 [Methanophagales archaeon]